MSPTTNLYLKAFIWFGIPYAIGMMIFDIADGEIHSIVKYFFMFVFFGGFMSALLVSSHISMVKELLGKTELTDEDLATDQFKTIVSTTSPTELVEKIQSTSEFKTKSSLVDNDSIQFKMAMSWYSWGEQIKISWPPQAGNQYNYIVSSKSKRFLDHGKSIENIQKIERLLG